MTLPSYYLGWEDLAGCQQAGVPILMYHKIAAPRVGWRGRGALLYVSARLFRRQLQELKAANVACQTMNWAANTPNATGANIVLTFDDGFENVFRQGLPAMVEQGSRAIVYLVADLLGRNNTWEMEQGHVRERLMDAAQVREWMAAGNAIGAHTLTHPHLTRLSVAQAREEVTASKKKLEDLFGLEVSDFCYPYGDHNEAVCGLVAEAGFRTATITKRGLNTAETPRMAMRRFMVRYPKWELGNWWRLWTKL